MAFKPLLSGCSIFASCVLIVMWSPLFVSQVIDHTCHEPRPSDFKSDEEIGYAAPWVFENRAGSVIPIPGIDNSKGQKTNGPLRIHFDDGSFGALTIEQGDCSNPEDCEPLDCGCFKSDSYWINLETALGKKVASYHLWAAYGNFQIVPLDLVDGPGDELLIFRQPNRGSPMYRYDLLIWKLGKAKPIELGHIEYVCEWLTCCCSRWRDNVYIDDLPKPRSLLLRRVFGSMPCCPPGRADDLVAERELHFYADKGKYQQ